MGNVNLVMQKKKTNIVNIKKIILRLLAKKNSIRVFGKIFPNNFGNSPIEKYKIALSEKICEFFKQKTKN